MNTAHIPCICPSIEGDVRHPEGDDVTLRERFDFRAAVAARNTIALAYQRDEDVSVPEILASLTEMYLILGVESWSLVDVKGKPLPVDRPHIKALMDLHPEEAMIVGDVADELYAEAVMRPLLRAASTSSPDTQTGPGTSVTNGSPSKLQKPSKRSSTSTSQTAVIGTTSSLLGGASN